MPIFAAAEDLPAAETGWQLTLLAIYCVLIVTGSLVGGWLPTIVRLTHTRMQVMISFVGGLMLGIGFFHLLPHAINQLRVENAMTLAVFGILTMFFLIRAFHVHHHGPLELPDASGTVVADSHRHQLQTVEEHEHATHSHDHDHDHSGHHHHHEVNRLSWMGIASGLALHTLIDGIALGASVRADVGNPVILSLFGFGTFLAVALHKPLDALAITSLMTAAGWSSSSRNLVNVAFAVMCPLGAVLFLIGLDSFNGPQQEIVASAMAFAAGVFICISLGDLLPEMEFHSHNRIPLTIALLAGIAISWLITLAAH